MTLTAVSRIPSLCRRRVASYYPAGDFVYSDLTDPGDGQFRIGTEVEHVLSQSIRGRAGQAMPINAGGAAILDWQHTPDGNYAVSMVMDLVNHPPGYDHGFTWYGFEDATHAGGTSYPRPDQLITTVNVLWDYYIAPGAVAAVRAFVGIGVRWDGYGALIEIDFNTQNWGDTNPNDPDIQIAAHPSGWDFIGVTGEGVGIVAPPRTPTSLSIDWRAILDTLIQREDQAPGRHFLRAPSDWGVAAVDTVYVGMEIANAVAGPCALGGLWLSGLMQWRKP